MQRLIAFSVVVVCSVSLLGGCEGIRTVVVPSESEIQVPGQGILAGNPLAPDDVFPSDALSEALAQNISQTFDTAGYDKDAVDSLKLTKLKMTVTEPEENGRQLRGLGFMEKLTISIAGEDVEAVVVAESDDGAFDGDPGPVEYEMPVTKEELKEAFLSGDAMEMDAELEPSEPPQFETNVLFETELTIVVNVFGAIN